MPSFAPPPRTASSTRCGRLWTASTRSSSSRPRSRRTGSSSTRRRSTRRWPPGSAGSSTCRSWRRAPTATFTLGRHHWETEEHVRASGAAWTFLRMNFYLDFLPMMVTDGVIAGPAGDGRAACGRARRHRGGGRRRAHRRRSRRAVLRRHRRRGAVTGRGRRAAVRDLQGRDARGGARVARPRTVRPTGRSRRGSAPTRRSPRGELEQVSDTVERLAGRAPLTLSDLI